VRSYDDVKFKHSCFPGMAERETYMSVLAITIHAMTLLLES